MRPISVAIANPTSRPIPGAVINGGTYQRWAPGGSRLVDSAEDGRCVWRDVNRIRALIHGELSRPMLRPLVRRIV